jgi:amino acid adenylation domain-containing protein
VHGVGQAGLDDLAYVVFTSGTSGTPKGVGVDQRALANYVADITEALRITPSDRLAVVSTLAADLGFTMVFPALACGACLHILSEPACQDPALFAAYFAAHAIDFLKIVPAHFAALRGPDGTMPRKALVLGGERASPDWVAQLRQVAPACRIVNHYGPTEATIGVLTGALDRADATPHGASLPLRRAVANAEIYLLDSGGAPVAPGAVGEVVIGGPCLARGYLGAAEAAAGGFVTIAGRRMYRTGDLARELGDGGIEILGRCDRQLKLRGLRIEPAHVEAALRRHPGVRDALVVPDADGAAAARLLGFVATAQTPPPTEAELAQFLRGVLPATMIPSRLLAVEAFPRTANGKTDVATLRRRLAGARPADARRLPRDAVELDLAHIWAEVLDLPEVGLDEDFFRLGGHSLLVIQLLARVQARFGRHLSLATVLRHPTIARMAAALRAAPGATGHEVLVPFGSASPNPPLFLLPGAGGSLSYLVPLARRLGARWPCWGLQGLGHLTRDAIPQNVEAIAAAYVARIRAPQPRGPYHLAGHSFGALLAYEMTRQLQDAGEAVAFLGLIDNAAPDDSAIVPERDDAAWLHHIALRIGKLTRTDLRLGELAGRDYRAQVAALMERITASGWLAEGISPAQFERFIEIYKANARAASRYRPPPLAAPAGAVVFRASAEDRELEPADVGRGPALGWDRLLVEAPEILESPGTHLTMFVEPQCAALAEQIDRCLIRVSGRMTASAA